MGTKTRHRRLLRRELIIHHGPVARWWTLHPIGDVWLGLIAALVAGIWVSDKEVSLSAIALVILALGLILLLSWAACLRLFIQINGTRIAGFPQGLPIRTQSRIRQLGWESILHAAIVAGAGMVLITLVSWSLIAIATIMIIGSTIRLVLFALPIISIALSSRKITR